MRQSFHYVVLAVLVVASMSVDVRAQELAHHRTIIVSADTVWWAGVVNHGHLYPLRTGYTIDLRGNLYGNQAQPLLLSNHGHYVWSDEPLVMEVTDSEIILRSDAPIRLRRSGETLRDAYHAVMNERFPFQGEYPDLRLFEGPQYNTWIELMYDQNQADILTYARSIVENGMQPGVLMIDDNWQENYGVWSFHPGRFPDPKVMIETLHELGFTVMMWVVPFVSPDSREYRDLERREFLLKDGSGRPAIVRWWNGASALLDLSNPGAMQWFTDRLDHLVEEYGVDGFKLDGGDAEYYVGTHSHGDVGPNEHARLFGEVGLRYPLNEYRAMWKMGGRPLAQRLRDKAHDWDDLRLLIPHTIVHGLSGYPFSCPDMIGGGEYGSFLDLDAIDQELVVRWTQASALMPMMQFSVAPWRILEAASFEFVRDVVELRSTYQDYITDLARSAASTGEPIVRSMEYAYPHRGYHSIVDQFLLGDDLLVAPVLERGADSRDVVVPPGRWRSASGEVVRGPAVVSVNAPLGTLPVFSRVAD
jgi:alpha-glucosidase (family GH31 glycosyl hydrolase)